MPRPWPLNSCELLAPLVVQFFPWSLADCGSSPDGQMNWIDPPFRVTGLRLHGLPPAPVLSSFPEVNVRTYREIHEIDAMLRTVVARLEKLEAAVRSGVR